MAKIHLDQILELENTIAESQSSQEFLQKVVPQLSRMYAEQKQALQAEMYADLHADLLQGIKAIHTTYSSGSGCHLQKVASALIEELEPVMHHFWNVEGRRSIDNRVVTGLLKCAGEQSGYDAETYLLKTGLHVSGVDPNTQIPFSVDSVCTNTEEHTVQVGLTFKYPKTVTEITVCPSLFDK